MNKEFSIEIKQTAWQDMEDIYHYLADNFKSRELAEKYYEAFITAISSLKYEAGIAAVYVFRHGVPLYRKIVRHYLIFYTVSGDKVMVLRVIYEKRNLKKHLKFPQ